MISKKRSIFPTASGYLSRRPSQIIDEIEITFSRPRHQVTTRAEGRFMEIRNAIYDQIRN